MDIKTYPEMNRTVKDLLRRSEDPMKIYILARIEELEKQVEDLATPPNPPLTLEELREMDGEPVWIKRQDGGMSMWAIIGDFVSLYGVYFGTAKGGLRLSYEECNKTWTAYRRKPEEGTT